MKGVAIPNHPSCFWFREQRLFMIVYVDDLLLSGPAAEHDKFWAKLGPHVSIDPPEDFDRFLGRHHLIKDCKSTNGVDLIEHFKSPIPV